MRNYSNDEKKGRQIRILFEVGCVKTYTSYKISYILCHKFESRLQNWLWRFYFAKNAYYYIVNLVGGYKKYYNKLGETPATFAACQPPSTYGLASPSPSLITGQIRFKKSLFYDSGSIKAFSVILKLSWIVHSDVKL